MKIFFSALGLLITSALVAQSNFPALSPAGRISQVVGFTTITVDYERPAVRGREIFGDLVPYGEVWRAGAGKCTRINFDRAVAIDNKAIAAGTYSLFTVPRKDKWTIILNSDTSLYGAGRYDVAKDVVRFDVKAESSTRFYEAFTIDIDVVPNNAVIYLSWEKTTVHFAVDTGADQKTIAFIDETLLTEKSLKANEYGAAVEYYLYQGRDLDKALKLTDLAVARDPKESWYYNLKVDVLEKQGNYADALVAAMNFVDLLEEHDKDFFGWNEETFRGVITGAKSRAAELKQKARN